MQDDFGKHEKEIRRSLKPPRLDEDYLKEWLDKHGYLIRKNMITHEIEISGMGDYYDSESLRANLHTVIFNEIQYDFACTSTWVRDLIPLVASQNRFNPVLDYLHSAPSWDGVNRFDYLCDVLHLSENDTLSRTLLKKWMMQSVSLLFNSEVKPFGADGVLTLMGKQGIGKTRFFELLAMRPDFVRLGQYLDFNDKDTIIRTTSSWITELGEIEQTFRTSPEKLKAFITNAKDHYRVPYGHADAHVLRRTSFCATANSERPLVDQTGSRRYWVIPVQAVDLKAMEALDTLQLWKQTEQDVHAEGLQAFRLTPNEQQLLYERNSLYQTKLKGQEEIEDILATAANDPNRYTWEYMTVSTFMTYHDVLRKYNSSEIGKALSRIGVEEKRGRGEGKQKRFRYLPRPTVYR